MITKDSAFLSIVIVLYAFFISFLAGIVGLIFYRNRKGKKGIICHVLMKLLFLFLSWLLVRSIFQIEDGKTKVGETKLREFLRKEKIDISHIRCIIVGCAHAGKTTFLRRLENTQFDKLKNEVKSTEMADIYVNMFEVSEDRETIESKLFDLKWKKKSLFDISCNDKLCHSNYIFCAQFHNEMFIFTLKEFKDTKFMFFKTLSAF